MKTSLPIKRWVCLLIIATFLLITTHRLPAPIQEVPESATPTPAVAPPAQPRKSPPKPKSKPSGATRFAGTWTGRITIDKFADTDVRLIISTDGTSVAQTSQAGVWTRPLTYDGKLLSWQTGPTNKVAWTLTLNPDEQSALVTRNWSGIQSRAIFKRVQSTEAPSTMPVRKSRPGGNVKGPSAY
jgi:hypothetical protein